MPICIFCVVEINKSKQFLYNPDNMIIFLQRCHVLKMLPSRVFDVWDCFVELIKSAGIIDISGQK